MKHTNRHRRGRLPYLILTSVVAMMATEVRRLKTPVFMDTSWSWPCHLGFCLGVNLNMCFCGAAVKRVPSETHTIKHWCHSIWEMNFIWKRISSIWYEPVYRPTLFWETYHSDLVFCKTRGVTSTPKQLPPVLSLSDVKPVWSLVILACFVFQNKLGDTALHAAAWKGYSEIVEMLLQKSGWQISSPLCSYMRKLE